MADERVRIFVSSPADVSHERALVKDLIDRLGQEYLAWFKLQAVLWEEEALTADRSFQAGLTQPADCDIVLVILWTRLGSPLPQQPYQGMTGTEWEFFNAVEAAARHGRPEVLVYKKTAPKLMDITDVEAAREAVADRTRLEAFFRTNFFNADNTFRRAFRTFDNAVAFRELLEGQLRKLLNRRISLERRYAGGELRWRGNPWRPDRPFDVADERVFTGREQELRDLLERLQRRAAAGRALVLLSGPSGAGKTSLLRAALLPRLGRPWQFAEVGILRACLLDPAADGPTPLAALAARLADQQMLGPALQRIGLDAPALARLLARDPGLGAAQIAGALGLHQDSATGGSRLVLVIDPFEACLGPVRSGAGASLQPAAATEAALAFAEALRALVASSVVWVVAALRSDALPRLATLTPLHDLLDADALAPLEPPPVARLRQMLEIPARIAGIELGGATGGPGLVEWLEAEAIRLRLWAPPVQGLLARACQAAEQAGRRNEHGDLVLDPQPVRASGGLAGELLSRAEALWAGLDADARAALPMLCRALVALEAPGSDGATLRQGDLTVLRADPHCARLLDALIAARLVVAEGLRDPTAARRCEPKDYRLRAAMAAAWRQGRARWLTGAGLDGNGAPPAVAVPAPPLPHLRAIRPVVSFVHPVLIEGFAPVRDWLVEPDNQRAVLLRFQLTRLARMWQRTDCNADYLLREAAHQALAPFAAAHGAELEPMERAFLEQSAAHLAFQRRRSALIRGVGVLLAGLVVMASVTAGLAWRASVAARVNLHRSLLKEADLYISRGNTPQAVALALAAGPDLSRRALRTLSEAFGSNRLLAMARVSGSGAEPAAAGGAGRPALDADGTLLASLRPDGTARLWRLEYGRFVAERDLGGSGLGLHTLLISASRHVYGLGRDGLWQLPASAGAPPDWPCGAEPEPVFALDRQRRLLALARTPTGPDDAALCVLDFAAPGRLLVDLALPDGALRSLAFSPDAKLLVTASAGGRAHVIDVQQGQVRVSLPAAGPLDRPLNQAVFDAQGQRIALAASDERVRLYHRDGTPIIELEFSAHGGRRVKVHRSAVRGVAFGLAGAFLVSVDDAGQVVRWSLDTLGQDGQAQAVNIGGHDLSVASVQIIDPPDPGETLVLTASLDQTARLWGLQSGRRYGVLGHDGPLTFAQFSADGRRVGSYSARDGTVRLWSVEPVSRLAHRFSLPDHVWHVAAAAAPPALAPDGPALLLATADFSGGVRVWRYRRTDPQAVPQPLAALPGHAGRARRVAFSADGGRLASAGFDGKAHSNDLITGTGCVASAADAPKGRVFQVLYSPAGRWLLTTGDDPETPVRVFDAADCRPLVTGTALDDPLPAKDGGTPTPAKAPARAPVQAAALLGLGDQTLVATGDDAGVVRLASVDAAGRWAARCRLSTDAGAVAALAFSPDGRRLAVAGAADSGELIAVGDQGCTAAGRLIGHTGALYSVAWAPDGQQLLTASLDKTARLWQPDGAPVAVLRGHRDRVYAAGFSPDGRWLLTASRDGSMRVWQRPTGARGAGVAVLEAFLPLPADLGGAADALFTPDGHYAIGAYWQNAALLWRLWREEDEPPAPEWVRRWGPERARLTLIDEAYRFAADNRVSELDDAPAGAGD